MTYRSAYLQSLTNDAEGDLLDVNFLLPILQEVDTALADMEARLQTLENGRS